VSVCLVRGAVDARATIVQSKQRVERTLTISFSCVVCTAATTLASCLHVYVCEPRHSEKTSIRRLGGSVRVCVCGGGAQLLVRVPTIYKGTDDI
jgi:hypothetical protein